MKIKLIFLFIFSFILRGTSQPTKTVVTKNFKFNDGIYTTFTDLQRNKPTVYWDSLETNLARNPTTFFMQLEYLHFKRTKQNVFADSIWGVVVDGIPYVRLSDKEVKKAGAYCFAGFILRGRICYFQYETIEKESVPITAYIPQTGEPYVTKNIVNNKSVVREKLFSFDTGEAINLTLSNFKRAIANDKDLLQTVADLKKEELSEKLFKCLLIYNDRNPVFLK